MSHDCRYKLLDKCQEVFNKEAVATQAVQRDRMAPITPMHKGMYSEVQAEQVAGQLHSQVHPQLTSMCRSALASTEHCYQAKPGHLCACLYLHSVALPLTHLAV